jgi:hypothetical protein
MPSHRRCESSERPRRHHHHHHRRGRRDYVGSTGATGATGASATGGTDFNVQALITTDTVGPVAGPVSFPTTVYSSNVVVAPNGVSITVPTTGVYQIESSLSLDAVAQCNLVINGSRRGVGQFRNVAPNTNATLSIATPLIAGAVLSIEVASTAGASLILLGDTIPGNTAFLYVSQIA